MTKKKENKEEIKPVAAQDAQADKVSANAEQREEQSKSPDYYDQLLRLQADFENYRKRAEKEKPMFIQFGKAEVIKKLLPLYDTMLKAEAEVNKKDSDTEHIKQGLNMIFEEFNKVFKSEGVEVVCSKGKPYDPMTQEVITTVPCEDKDDGKVADELCRCVTFGGQVLRYAQVIVGKKKEEENQEQKDQKEQK
ncbi:MAG: nucleotide exchange factor GrpE [Elusimicrobiota bacterium]|jgi:molecular chaperone GrpE|nr:nucleotide exchange factor GrpE [Elusimicrobiota bacterium]